MIVHQLTVDRFRNLQKDTISFSPGVNVIYGKNAQGKTNLLEALWLFTGGHSFRGIRDSELTAFGQAEAKLKLDFFSEERDQTMALSIRGGKRQFTVNGVEKRSGADVIGKFCGVIFSPEHLSFVKNGPSLRRSFLDGALCQSRPTYARDFVLYQRALQQRNALLKEISKQPSLQPTLEIWNRSLAQRGVKVIRQRQEMTRFLDKTAREIYRGLSQDLETFSIQYDCTVSREETVTESLFLERLSATEKSDIATGHTAVGPHRDDLELTIDGNSARLYGSQGQQRSAVLALKLSEAAVLEQMTGEKPVILLDDVMSELDGDRQSYLLHRIRDRQIFLTCCDPHPIQSLTEGAALLVEAGRVTGRMLA